MDDTLPNSIEVCRTAQRMLSEPDRFWNDIDAYVLLVAGDLAKLLRNEDGRARRFKEELLDAGQHGSAMQRAVAARLIQRIESALGVKLVSERPPGPQPRGL